MSEYLLLQLVGFAMAYLRMMMPTMTGPIMVHSMTAHTITKKTSSPVELSTVTPFCCNVNVPELCDNDAIKKPISPLATIANAIMIAWECGALWAFSTSSRHLAGGELFFLNHVRLQ